MLSTCYSEIIIWKYQNVSGGQNRMKSLQNCNVKDQGKSYSTQRKYWKRLFQWIQKMYLTQQGIHKIFPAFVSHYLFFNPYHNAWKLLCFPNHSIGVSIVIIFVRFIVGTDEQITLKEFMLAINFLEAFFSFVWLDCLLIDQELLWM